MGTNFPCKHRKEPQEWILRIPYGYTNAVRFQKDIPDFWAKG